MLRNAAIFDDKTIFVIDINISAGIAQLEEQRLCKSKVVGLSPATGSKKNKRKNGDRDVYGL